MGTVSCDCSFRLWDVATGQQRCCRTVTRAKCSGWTSSATAVWRRRATSRGVCRVWDLRTGRCVSTLQGGCEGRA